MVQVVNHVRTGPSARVMLDAGAGVSRHELLLTAQAVEKAKFARVLGGATLFSVPKRVPRA